MLKSTNLIEFFKDIIIPPVCSVCGNINSELLCTECKLKIVKIDGNICKYCGRSISGYERGTSAADKSSTDSKICSLCRKENFNFYRLRSFALYKGVVRKIIHKYKYQKLYNLKKILVEFLKQVYNKYYRSEKIDYIETVPGDHMHILCSEFSTAVSIPFISNIIKIKKTPRQQTLNLYQRKNNLKGAFKVRSNLLVSGKNILLIDDIWTTGSTLDEISLVLKNSNVDKIYLLTIAKGM